MEKMGQNGKNWTKLTKWTQNWTGLKHGMDKIESMDKIENNG